MANNLYKHKAIISGDIIEVYEYEHGVKTGGDDRNRVGRSSKNATEEEKYNNRVKTMWRAKSNLRRLINANVGAYQDDNGRFYPPVFLTLTFAENITSLDYANQEFMKFVKRLNYHTGSKKAKLKYVAVVEFQKRGAVHYHAIFFNLIYLSANEIEEIWGNGFIKVNMIDNVDNVGAYVSKYMGKSVSEERLLEEKSYFSSKGLIKPVEVTDRNEFEKIVSVLPLEVYLSTEMLTTLPN